MGEQPLSRTSYRDELFVDDDGSPETAWCVAEGRSALDAAKFVDGAIGLDGGDGFGVSLVYGVIEPWPEGTSEWRFRKPTEHERRDGDVMIPMWEVQLA